jgi:hypothetical protein
MTTLIRQQLPNTGESYSLPELLNEQQAQRALEVMREYLNAPRNAEDGLTPREAESALDRKRIELIAKELRPLLTGFLGGDIPLEVFKSRVDGINKRHEYWGFKGIKGQMFFNMLVNVADDLEELDQEIKTALQLPQNEVIASSRIKTFASYVSRLGDQVVESGGTKHRRPKVGSVPFFLSYFWQILDSSTWPIYYTNSVNVMTDLNLWQPAGDLAVDYITYKRLHEELATLFTSASGENFDLYEVEHVFWAKGGNPRGGEKPAQKTSTAPLPIPTVVEDHEVSTLPDSYVPPIVMILPRMARNEPILQEAAKRSGTNLDRAFEKGIDAAFRVLGYESKLLGQGQGRVPDGVVISADDSYAVLWDAKVRGQGYSMGTDDRTIREYITTQSRELKRRRSLRNIYYAIVSSHFEDDFDDAIKSIKMETDVNEVCLVEVEALVAMVDAKLRDPRQVTLGPDGLQRLFSDSGVLSEETVRTTFQ